MPKKIQKDIIHAKGVDIGIYTEDSMNCVRYESEGPSQSVTNQQSLLNEFVQQHRLSVFDIYIEI